MKSVSIFGAGISGLTVAHELSEKGFDVYIYEKDDDIGGMGKSKINSLNIPTEHSWRGYNPSFYINCVEIMKRIPTDFKCNTNEYFENEDEKVYDISEVQKHKSENDLWTYYEGNVYDITEFVRRHPGGRSILKAGGKNLKTVWEDNRVSWHNKYDRVQNILKKYKIGRLKEGFSHNKRKYSVYDNLKTEKLKFSFLKKDRQMSLGSVDYIKLALLVAQNICSDKRKTEWKNILARDYIKDNFGEDVYEYILYGFTGPGIGADLNSISLYQFCYFTSFYTDNWRAMNKPTSQAWFDHWKKYLVSKNVKFIRSSLKKINVKDKRIINCEMSDGAIVSSDEFCFALNPNNAIEIFENSNMKDYETIFTNLRTVNNQISFCIVFNKKIYFPKDINSIVLIDSLFNITMYPQDRIWCKDYFSSTRSLWSGTCCQSQNGIQLTIEEFKKEIIKQIFECTEFLNILQRNNNNYRIQTYDIEFIDIYDEWVYKDGRIETKNKKWVNTLYNDEFKPTNSTVYDNFYITGGHTKTSFEIWSMESSVESGKISANLILSKYKKQKAFIHTHSNNAFIRFLGLADNVLYAVALPNIVVVLILLLVVSFVVVIIIALRRRKKSHLRFS